MHEAVKSATEKTGGSWAETVMAAARAMMEVENCILMVVVVRLGWFDVVLKASDENVD